LKTSGGKGLHNRLKRAVFLDRDGVIVEQREYLNRPEDLILIPGAGEAIALLNASAIPVIVVSNQAGVAKGYLTLSDLEAIHARLRRELSAHGAHLDAIYYCPHHREATVPEFLRDCPCRKPGIGMFERARDEHGIDLSRSYLVGDATGDILAGRRAGCRTILVSTGFGGTDGRYTVEPDLQVSDLSEAVARILTEVGR
jgi:D-glycero-D-manno-heptose 1,7-bisphosphate phosphatase